MIRGSVSYEGRPQKQCEVRLCDLDGGSVVANASTDEEGAFTIDATRPGHAFLAARCVDEAIGVAGAEPSGTEGNELRVESGGRLWSVDLEVDAPGGVPLGLDLSFDAVELREAPDFWLAAVRVPFAGVARASFATLPLPEGRIALPVQAGRWRFAAQRVVRGTAHVLGATPESTWVTGGATVQGRYIAAVDLAVPIEVIEPLRVVLHLVRLS